MREDLRVKRFEFGAALGSRPGRRAFPPLLLCATMLWAWMLWSAALAAQAPAVKAAGQAKAAEPAPAGFVGADTCAACHDAEAKGFANNPHSRMVLMHGSTGVTCESCHGPGQAHVESGGTTKMFDFTTAQPKAVDAQCLVCHAGAHPNFDRSPHARAGVSCTSCHSVHAAKAPEHLLRASQPALCFQCHTDVKGSFDMPFHHPVNEGVVQCSDCHDVHGTFGNSNLRSTADQNMICTKCHTDVRGPFVYEHAAVKAEGCLGCHSPHGSQNARMLNMPSVNTLCNQCHSPVSAATVHGMNAGSSEILPCISCHTMIHGSNLNQAFLK